MQPPGARVKTLCRRKERDRDHILNECAEREKCDGKCAPDSKKCHPHRFSRIVAQISCPWDNRASRLVKLPGGRMPESRTRVSRFWAIQARALALEIAINGGLDFVG